MTQDHAYIALQQHERVAKLSLFSATALESSCLLSAMAYQASVAAWIRAVVVAVLQDVVDSLIGLLTWYSTPPALARSASSTADASPQSDEQQSTSSAQTAQQSYETQKSPHTKITQGGDLLGGDQNPLGLIQHWHTEMQPMILSGLLACLPQDPVFSKAIFVDCEKWYIQVAENLFLLGQQQEEPWLAIPFITPYLHMMRMFSPALFDSTNKNVACRAND